MDQLTEFLLHLTDHSLDSLLIQLRHPAPYCPCAYTHQNRLVFHGFTGFSQNLCQLFQKQVSNNQSILLIDLSERIYMKSKKGSLLLGAAHILNYLQPFFHIIKGSDRIHFFPADLLQLLFLLLIDIVQISCNHSSGICFIRDHLCRQVKPLIIPFFILFQPEIFVYGILGICKAVCDSSQVQRMNINACKNFRLLAAAPDAIPSFAVHNFNLILPDPVGKKDIL